MKTIYSSLSRALRVGACLAALAPTFATAGETWFEPGAKWNFNKGPEYPGATGDVALETVDEKNALELDFDFTGGGGYVLGGHAVENGKLRGFRISVKADTAVKILIRAEDANREWFQVRLDYVTPGTWEVFTVNLEEPQLVFGGDENKELDLPLRSVYFGASIKGVTELGGNEKGTVFFSEAEAIGN